MRKNNELIISKLLSSKAREQVEEIALEASQNNKLLKDLIYLFIHDSYRITQRVSWVLVFIAEIQPKLLIPFEAQLLESLQKSEVGDAIKRNVMRIWSITGVSKNIEGLVYDLCISYIIGKEAIAIKVHSISVAYSIAMPWIELRNELKVAVQDLLVREGSSAGIRSKCKRLLKELSKN